MSPRTITEKIVEYWALGFSAEETREALQEKQNVSICLTTIYKHRHSLTAQNLIDELIRRQERAILKADSDNPELAMKYRNELLKILVPQRIEALTFSKQEITINTPDYSEEEKLAILNAYGTISNKHGSPVRPNSLH
ncbi:hypothetical protein MUP79_01660 [Candidatus Bathyarchaeota archaeon]|nr:hypothetical protein [Candidatus Bathyarchaeota archaeon]